MNELAKVKRVLKKIDADAPYEVMLVLDATTGQNALSQAKSFLETADVSGISLTKLDGTAKGGILFAIVHALKLPLRFIGIGEAVDDLRVISAHDFVEALLKAGVVKQNVPKNYLHIDQAIGYSDPKRGVDIHIMPSDQFRVTFMLDYEFKTLGTQFTTMDELEKNFATIVPFELHFPRRPNNPPWKCLEKKFLFFVFQKRLLLRSYSPYVLILLRLEQRLG